MPPLMKESEFGMKTTRRTLIVILLALLLIFPQVTIVPDALAAGESLEAEADDIVAIVNEFTVTQAVNTYFQGREAFLTSGDATAFIGTISSVVRDEQLHLQELQELNLVFVNSVLEFDSLSCESLYAKSDLSNRWKRSSYSCSD